MSIHFDIRGGVILTSLKKKDNFFKRKRERIIYSISMVVCNAVGEPNLTIYKSLTHKFNESW